jgi:hypothetical protein
MTPCILVEKYKRRTLKTKAAGSLETLVCGHQTLRHFFVEDYNCYSHRLENSHRMKTNVFVLRQRTLIRPQNCAVKCTYEMQFFLCGWTMIVNLHARLQTTGWSKVMTYIPHSTGTIKGNLVLVLANWVQRRNILTVREHIIVQDFKFISRSAWVLIINVGEVHQTLFHVCVFGQKLNFFNGYYFLECETT